MSERELIASEQVTPKQLLARLEAAGVRATIKLRLEGDTTPPAELVEAVGVNRDDLIRILTEVSAVPRLPASLEALLRAASSDVLPKGTFQVEQGFIPDLSTYTLAWAACYLVGADRGEALRRLWGAYRAWRGVN